MNKECTFKSVDGFSISAVHSFAENPKGVVLWLPGITVDKDEYQCFFKDGAEYLTSRNIDSLRIDFRGHGKSSGTSLDFSVSGQMLDVAAALNYLEQYYDDQPPKLQVAACSFGAPPAIFTALTSKLVSWLTLISPVLSYRRTFLEPETDWAKEIFTPAALLTAAKTNKLFFDSNFVISMRLVEEMRMIRPDKALRHVRQPTIVIHGDADSMVPFDISKKVSKRARVKKFVRIRGMDHGFADADDESGQSKRSIKNKLRMYELIEQQF